MPKSYDQYCPLAVALDAVGDRWALLVVRELLLGPRRFGQLLEGLRDVSTDVLTVRLRELEAAGIVSRTVEGRSSSYELTEEGRGLIPALRELSTWGVNRLGLPDGAITIPPRMPLAGLSMATDAKIPKAAAGRYEVRCGDEVVGVTTGPSGTRIVQGEVEAADARIRFTISGLLALLIGSSLQSLIATGEAEIVEGDGAKATVALETLARAGVLGRLLAT